jgi:hypothetical protein
LKWTEIRAAAGMHPRQLPRRFLLRLLSTQ